MLAYAGAYLVGALVSYSMLRRVLGGLETPTLVRFLVRLLIAAALAAAARLGGRPGLQAWCRDRQAAAASGKVHALALLGVTGLVDVAVFLGARPADADHRGDRASSTLLTGASARSTPGHLTGRTTTMRQRTREGGT